MEEELPGLFTVEDLSGVLWIFFPGQGLFKILF